MNMKKEYRFLVLWSYFYTGWDGKEIEDEYPVETIGQTDDFEEAKKMADGFDLDGELASLAREQGLGTCVATIEVIDQGHYGYTEYERHLESSGEENEVISYVIRDNDGEEMAHFDDYDDAINAFRFCERYLSQTKEDPYEDCDGNQCYPFTLYEVTSYTDTEDLLDDDEEELESTEVIR